MSPLRGSFFPRSRSDSGQRNHGGLFCLDVRELTLEETQCGSELLSQARLRFFIVSLHLGVQGSYLYGQRRQQGCSSELVSNLNQRNYIYILKSVLYTALLPIILLEGLAKLDLIIEWKMRFGVVATDYLEPCYP